MELRRIVHNVHSASVGDETRYESGHLSVDAREAASLFDAATLDVTISVVSPGDSARIVKVLDGVEPRAKGPGGGRIFPGLLSRAGARARPDEVHVLRGAAVLVAGALPRAQEAIVEMRGAGAPLSPFGSTHNVVVEFEPAPGAPWEQVDEALRIGSLRLAVRLAEAGLGEDPDDVEELPSPVPQRSTSPLPRVGVVTNLQTQGAFKDVFVYGRSMAGALPTLIDADELEDGAVVSGQYGHPGLRNPTYVHQNHPIVNALRRRHGRDLHFAGLVLSPEPVDQDQKELVSAHAADLCRAAGFDAVVLTKEGGGNADADVALKMDYLERLGVRAVGLFAEMAGPDGTGPSLVVPPAAATAMVSTGNYDERILLPTVERALGGERVDVAGARATDSFEVPVAVIAAALSPLGWGTLRCREAA